MQHFVFDAIIGIRDVFLGDLVWEGALYVYYVSVVNSRHHNKLHNYIMHSNHKYKW